MKRIVSIGLAAALAAACGGPSSGIASPGPSAAATAASLPPGDPTIVEERAAGVTIKEGDSGTVDLQGGRYRIAWYAKGCTRLGLQIAAKTGGTTSVDVRLPSGEAFVDLPAGIFAVNRVGDCDYTVRFEDASQG
jgi:hypothetical protein